MRKFRKIVKTLVFLGARRNKTIKEKFIQHNHHFYSKYKTKMW